MKNVVINQVGSTSEFKPDSIFEKYLDLTRMDVRAGLCAKNKMKAVSCCPACKAREAKKAFSQFGFNYSECQKCGSVYLNPRPLDADIKEYYMHSKAARFWRDTLARKTEGKRKEKIYEKRFQWLSDVSENYLPSAETIADFNSKDPEYVREFLGVQHFKRKILVNPYFDTAVLNDSSVDVNEILTPGNPKTLLKHRETVDVACSFEAIDCSSDIESLLKSVHLMLHPKGIFFLTTISISGFDLQVLWDKSSSIFPPDRINVLSKKGLEILFKRHGFDMIEYSTPGFLDLDIVKNAVRKDPSIGLPRFVKTILENGDEQVYRDFQEFLQLSKLSSFTRIVLRKR